MLKVRRLMITLLGTTNINIPLDIPCNASGTLILMRLQELKVGQKPLNPDPTTLWQQLAGNLPTSHGRLGLAGGTPRADGVELMGALQRSTNVLGGRRRRRGLTSDLWDRYEYCWRGVMPTGDSAADEKALRGVIALRAVSYPPPPTAEEYLELAGAPATGHAHNLRQR